jgi:hypothetical protein
VFSDENCDESVEKQVLFYDKASFVRCRKIAMSLYGWKPLLRSVWRKIIQWLTPSTCEYNSSHFVFTCVSCTIIARYQHSTTVQTLSASMPDRGPPWSVWPKPCCRLAHQTAQRASISMLRPPYALCELVLQ